MSMSRLALMALVGATIAEAQIPAAIEFRVPKPATLAAGDSGSFFVYELHVTNLALSTVTLKRVEVRDEADTSVTLLSVGDSALLSILTRPAQTMLPSERPNIAGGSRANLFLWVPASRGSPPPAALSHRLTFKRIPPDSAALARLRPDSATRVRLLADTATFVVTGAVTAIAGRAMGIAAPLRGEWLAANGPANQSGHRRSAIALGGTVAIAQRFGIDFLQVDQDGRSWRGDSTSNASYFAYGDTIFSVAAGRVVATKDRIPENTPRGPVARAVPIDLVTIGGNHIVVDIGNGHFAFYAHLQPGSLRVRTGERVARAQPIGLVGNSGNSTEPHLHFHVVDGLAAGTSTLGAEGLPYSLSAFDLVGRCQLSNAGIRCSRVAPVTIRNAMPLQNQLVRFPH